MITTAIATSKTQPMDNTLQLNQFFVENEKKAYVIANMSLKNPDDALDVVQDVMIKFVEKYRKKDFSDWASLFYRMLHNRITDFHRKNTQRKSLFSFFHNEEEDNVIDQAVEDNEISILQKLDYQQQMQSLQNTLNNLPTRQLQAFICRIWEGLSVEDTAKSMKCSQGSVKTHLFRALQQIRTQIEFNEDSYNG